MRINERNYESFIRLQESDQFHLKVDEKLIEWAGMEAMPSIIEHAFRTFKNIKHKFYLTDTFVEAIDKSRAKLSDAMQNDTEPSDNMGQGTLIMHKNGFVMHDTTWNKDGKRYVRLFIFSRDALVGFGYVPIEEPQLLQTTDWGFLSHKTIGGKEGIEYFFKELILVLYFIHQCEIETVTIKPKEKLKVHNVKYYNEKGTSDITLLDCKWFRELVVDGVFQVSGHLRWQACGEGRTKRKLIWIDAFEKQGYHRRAKIENIH